MEERKARVELKYCERCGGLWLRPVLSRNVYCHGCEQQMRDLPFAGYRKAGVRGHRVRPQPDAISAANEPATTLQGGAF
ncbi:MAG TPA: hypothetical protein VKW78_18205 [Terriglobales bacterium]|nr:hypothetical protein [Terriglobales bacterium]